MLQLSELSPRVVSPLGTVSVLLSTGILYRLVAEGFMKGSVLPSEKWPKLRACSTLIFHQTALVA